MLIVYHTEADAWWADSPDVAGFHAGDESLSALRRRVREALAFFLGRDVEDVDLDVVESFEDGSPVRQVRFSQQPPSGAQQWRSLGGGLLLSETRAGGGIERVSTPVRTHTITVGQQRGRVGA